MKVMKILPKVSIKEDSLEHFARIIVKIDTNKPDISVAMT